MDENLNGSVAAIMFGAEISTSSISAADLHIGSSWTIDHASQRHSLEVRSDIEEGSGYRQRLTLQQPRIKCCYCARRNPIDSDICFSCGAPLPDLD